MNGETFRNILDKKTAEKNLLLKQIEAAELFVEKGEVELMAIEAAQVSIQTIAEKTQSQVKVHIEDIVTSALYAVIDDPYEFKVIFEPKRGQTEARLVFLQDREEVDPMESTGGGAVDIAAFALRIALWAIEKTSNTLIFDEPFRFLSAKYQPKAGVMMKELSRELGIQFILVTHNEALKEIADTSIIVNKQGKKSYATNQRQI